MWELTHTLMDTGFMGRLPAWSLGHTKEVSVPSSAPSGGPGWRCGGESWLHPASQGPSSVHGVQAREGNQPPQDISLGQIWALSFLGVSNISVHLISAALRDDHYCPMGKLPILTGAASCPGFHSQPEAESIQLNPGSTRLPQPTPQTAGEQVWLGARGI